MDVLLKLVIHALTAMFVIGMAGCVIVIPIVAYRLFSVLLERDYPEDEAPNNSRARPVAP